MGYLIDTNVLSEMRKGARANPNVQAWVARYIASEVFLSTLVIGEIRRGIEIVRRKDSDQAEAIERWLTTVTSSFGDRILPVTRQIAEEWGVSPCLIPSLSSMGYWPRQRVFTR